MGTMIKYRTRVKGKLYRIIHLFQRLSVRQNQLAAVLQ
jgi:hypothetical protein